MKARPSIAFDKFSGTAKEVTARDTKNGTVLSVRAKQSQVSTPAQKNIRAMLTNTGRTYRKLTDEQQRAWSLFAKDIRSNRPGTLPGQDTRLTGCSVFMRHNCNRALLGLSPLKWPPEETVAVPDFSFGDVTVTPELIEFTGIATHSSGLRLCVTMTRGISRGVSQGWGKAVIIDPGFIPDRGVADVTRIYASVLGVTPVVGEKYFITAYWIDRATGFAGQRTLCSRECVAAV